VSARDLRDPERLGEAYQRARAKGRTIAWASKIRVRDYRHDKPIDPPRKPGWDKLGIDPGGE
jgi:hypothetical protein